MSEQFLSVIIFQAKITIMMIDLFIFFTFQSVSPGLGYLIRAVGVAFLTLLGDSETETEKYPHPSQFLCIPGPSM